MYKKVFLDANVIADLYDENRPFNKESERVVSTLVTNNRVELFTSCDIITTLYYILSKRGKEKALDSIREVNELCTVVDFANKEVRESCEIMKSSKKYKDLEDTIEYVMAKKMSCDLIISNDKGFVSEEVKLLSAKEFLEELDR
jgi:predicted nucleic acid-binding protein